MKETVVLIETKRDRPAYKRLYEARKDPERIAAMRKKLEEVAGLFMVRRDAHPVCAYV